MNGRGPGSIRAASPTGTTYSGISNYKSDAYRPLGHAPMPSLSSDTRNIARTHFEELHQYLASYLAKGAYAFPTLLLFQGLIMGYDRTCKLSVNCKTEVNSPY